MKILYFDCFSGISGDMVLGALIDAGADAEVLKNELKKLGIEDEYKLDWRTVVKQGISATKFDVICNQSDKTALADKHVHENDHHHDESHHHENYHHHGEHDHHNVHNHHSHHNHSHRSYKSIVKMIYDAQLDKSVEESALNIFAKIAEAEAKIHGISVNDVHFHEVGAVDSIIDVVGAAILINSLGIDAVHSSPVPVGTGRIRIDHGVYPVPAPATLEILKGVPLAKSEVLGELTTPTGAGIISALVQSFGSIPAITVSSIGYGAGTKDFQDHPNVLRAIIGES